MQVPPIDSESTSGVTLQNLRGQISFSNVSFSYPTRSSVKVFITNKFRFSSGPQNSRGIEFLGFERFHIEYRTQSNSSTGWVEWFWKVNHCQYSAKILPPQRRNCKFSVYIESQNSGQKRTISLNTNHNFKSFELNLYM